MHTNFENNDLSSDNLFPLCQSSLYGSLINSIEENIKRKMLTEAISSQILGKLFRGEDTQLLQAIAISPPVSLLNSRISRPSPLSMDGLHHGTHSAPSTAPPSARSCSSMSSKRSWGDMLSADDRSAKKARKETEMMSEPCSPYSIESILSPHSVCSNDSERSASVKGWQASNGSPKLQRSESSSSSESFASVLMRRKHLSGREHGDVYDQYAASIEAKNGSSQASSPCEVSTKSLRRMRKRALTIIKDNWVPRDMTWRTKGIALNLKADSPSQKSD
eukprot:3863-Hanusia_phi.AAC.1